MLFVVVLIAGFLYITSKNKTKVIPTQVGTASVTNPPLQNQLTKIPLQRTPQVISPANPATEELPPFYQTSNAGTPSSPITKPSVGVTKVLPYVGQQPHNNLRLSGEFSYLVNDVKAISRPISADSIAPDEFTSVGLEQANSFEQVAEAIPNPTTFNPAPIIKPPTVNAPSAVGSAPYYAFNGTPNDIAPNPLPNPTFEKTVPVIASSLIKTSLAPTVAERWLP